MAWSYSPADLEIALNWVRLRIGDTDVGDQQLSDEEIISLGAYLKFDLGRVPERSMGERSTNQAWTG